MRRRAVVATIAGLLLLWPSAALAQPATAPDRTEEPVEVGIGQADDAGSPAQGAPDRQPAQEPSDETGIGEAASVECRGSIRASVVDLDGAPVAGALLSVAGQQFSGSGTVDADCGEWMASLLAAPDGYALAGPETLGVQVRQSAVTPVTFTVDPVEVLGVQLEQPTAPPAAPAPADAAPPTTDTAAPELAATGPEDAPTLMLVALVVALVGVVLVAATPPPPAPGRR